LRIGLLVSIAIALEAIVSPGGSAAGGRPSGQGAGAGRERPAADIARHPRTPVQAPAAPAGFDARLARADSLFGARQAGAAASILDSLRWEARAGHQRSAELRVLLAEARLNGLLGRPRPGRASARSALELAGDLQDTLAVCQSLRWLAVAAQLEGAMAESRDYARRLLGLARSRGDRFHEGQGWLLLAYSDLVRGDSEAAAPEYQEAVRAFGEVHDVRFELMARQGLGNILAGRGDLEGARLCYQRVLEGTRTQGDPFGEARALNDLGVLEFSCGDPSAAVDFYRQAHALQVQSGDLSESVTSATNLAIVHTYLGEFEEAARLLDEAWDRCAESGNVGAQAAVLEQMAIVRREQREYAEAARLFRKGAVLAEKISPSLLARDLTGLAQTLGFRDSAAAGVAVLSRRFDPIRHRVAPLERVTAERTYGELLFLAGRPGQALERFRTAERIGRSHGLGFLVGLLTYESRCHARLGRPDSARLYLDRAVEAWESQRARIQDPEWREQLDLDGRLLYAEIARQALAESHDPPAGNPQTARGEAVEAAFDAVQRFKARTLRERMLAASLRSSGPGSRPALAPVTLAELQTRCLAPEEVLLDFFYGKDGIYLFAVTRAECRLSRIPSGGASLERSLRRYRQLVSMPASDPAGGDEGQRQLREAAARRLSNAVLGSVADLLRQHPRVLLALDGMLNVIPVELWPAPSGSGSVPRETPPRSMTRIASATMLRDRRLTRTRSTATPPEHGWPGGTGGGPVGILAILQAGNPSASGAEGPALRGARAETSWLRRSFRDVRIRRMAGGAADSIGTEELARCEVVHLAAHVRVDDVHPWRSGLPGLRAGRIAEMRLPARLAVLAGCESAGGRVVSGEGVLGLTAAFQSAGVPAVVATLWPVSDRATASLMRAFYGALARGRPVEEALREGQRVLQADPETRHPRYWAAFVVFGDGATGIPLRRRVGALEWLLLGAALVSGAGLAEILRRRMRRAAV
jgi:tetratricopeptide (TPR) repeat protein